MIKLTVKSIHYYKRIEHANFEHKCWRCPKIINRHDALYRYGARILCVKCYWEAVEELQEAW